MERTGALGRVYQDGEAIVHQGEVGDCMYVIQEGQVEMVVEKAGEEVHLMVLDTGELLGEMAIVEREVRMATVRALGQTRVLTIVSYVQRTTEDSPMRQEVAPEKFRFWSSWTTWPLVAHNLRYRPEELSPQNPRRPFAGLARCANHVPPNPRVGHTGGPVKGQRVDQCGFIDTRPQLWYTWPTCGATVPLDTSFVGPSSPNPTPDRGG